MARSYLRDSRLHPQGAPIGTMDALIAVIAMAHGARIVTFDQDFLVLQKHCGIGVEWLSRPT